MCICCCMCVVYVCAYVREKVMFEVYGGESQSMSDQMDVFFCCQPFIKNIAFRRMTASMLAFLVINCIGILNSELGLQQVNKHCNRVKFQLKNVEMLWLELWSGFLTCTVEQSSL